MADYPAASTALIDKIKQSVEATGTNQPNSLLTLAQAYAEVRKADAEAARGGALI